MTCVGGMFGGDWRRSSLDWGEAAVGGTRWLAVRVSVRARLRVAEQVIMLEELEGVEAVAVKAHRGSEGGVEAAVVKDLAL